MAILNLTIYGVSISKKADNTVESNLVLSTEETTVGKNVSVVKKEVELTNKDNTKCSYYLSLVNLQFRKKMYQPTEINAEISVVLKKSDDPWVPVSRSAMEELFLKKKVSLVDMQGVTSETIPEYKKVGEDFYVQSVHVKYKSDYMRVILRIFSLDKVMTLENTCRTFVGKKLKAGILTNEIKEFVAPYDKEKKLAFDANSMKNLAYQYNGTTTSEHIFPFLVQYNESFYDMLARTTNRWGEFMYYENGKLFIGCPESTAYKVPTTKDEFSQQQGDVKLPLLESMSYFDVDEQEARGDKYDCGAGYEGNMLDDPIRIDPKKISGNLFCWGGKLDKVVMKKFSSFFKNDKNIPTFLGGELFNDLYDLAKQGSDVSSSNNDREDAFFTDEKKNLAEPEQYGEHDYGKKGDEDKAMSFNPFSEIGSKYDKAKYFNILKNEISAGKDAVCINFDTSYPNLKLGQIIEVYAQQYIVTQIDCLTNIPIKLKDDLWVVSSDKADYSFQVYALAKQANQFYPTVIPAGHVRLADPQIATVTDAGDPNDSGRVRVMFSWQDIKKDEDDKITDDTKKISSPWIQFAANAGGQKGIMGKHYEGDKVFVGFVDGNVERPYVMGAISNGAGADIHCATAGGHQLKINDDAAGIMSFLTGMFSPAWGSFSDFIPGMGDLNPFSSAKNNLALAGGFELSDNYGLYKISGSTDSREVNIASPWGDVNINAFTGITISAPNGDVTIKGKNVRIEAGNNLDLVSGTNVGYKLWKSKNDEKAFSGATLAVSMAALVAKKLAEKFIQVVDLSMVRSVVEVVMRPMEGALTVKSNRFLKLESGDKECEYPKLAFNEEKKMALLNAEVKDSILSTVGSGANLSVGDGTVTLINAADAVAKDLCTRFMEKYNACVDKKEEFNVLVRELTRWADDNTKAVCNTYDEMKNDLWKETDLDKKFEEDKVGIKDDNVKISDRISGLSDAKSLVSDACFARLKSNFQGSDFKRYKMIIGKRRMMRLAVISAARDLRKAICDLYMLEMKQEDVNKHFSWYWTTMPKDFKKKMLKAVSKEKCPNAPVYKIKDIKKNLSSRMRSMPNTQKYMKRLIAMNLLEELGFTDDMRKKVNGAVVAKPDASTLSPATAGNIMHDVTWRKYVKSLSGVPPISKATDTLGGAVKGAVKGVIDDMYETANLKKSYHEWYAWGDGKKGSILIGSADDTFELRGNEFKKVEDVLKPSLKSLNGSTLDDSEKEKVEAFVKKIKGALIKF